MPGTDRFAVVNELKLHYIEHGRPDATTIVCLHGAGGNAHSWDLFAPFLEGRYRVLALTFRGHGNSDRATVYTAGWNNLDAAEFIRTLGVAPAVLCGHSLGAGVAIGVAALWPALVSHVVLVDGSIRPNAAAWQRIIDSMKERPESFASSEDAIIYFRGLMPGPSDEEVRRFIETDLAIGSDGRYRRKYDPEMSREGLAATKQQVDEASRLAEEMLRRGLRSIQCPTLLVRATRSDILEPEIAAEMISLLKYGRLIEIESNHWVQQERPRELADAVMRLLEAEPPIASRS